MENPTAASIKNAIEAQKVIWEELIEKRADEIGSLLAKSGFLQLASDVTFYTMGTSYLGYVGEWQYEVAMRVRYGNSFVEMVEFVMNGRYPVVTNEQYDLIREFWELHDLMEEL